VARNAVQHLGGVSGAQYFGRRLEAGMSQATATDVYWFVSVGAPNPAPAGVDVRSLLDGYLGAFHAPFRALVAATVDADLRVDELVDRPPLSRWGEGAVTLLGDAAHPTTPNLGQGGSMAIEDAVVLAHALERAPSLAEALADYERRRVARTARIVDASFRFGKLAQIRNPMGIFLRNLVLRLTPESIVQRELARAAEFSLEEAASPAMRAASRPTP